MARTIDPNNPTAQFVPVASPEAAKTLCCRKAEGFGEWVNAYTSVIPSGNGALLMETHDLDPLQDNNPCVLLLTREAAGRLGTFLVEAAKSEGWNP